MPEGETDESISIIVPAWNEEEGIRKTIDDLLSVLSSLKRSYEVIVVDDGSSDGTIHELANYQGRIELVRHARNRGYGAALKSGLRRARHPIAVIIDCDGTYPVKSIPNLLDRLVHDGAAMVVGARTGENVSYPLVRLLPKSVLKLFAEWIVGAGIPDLNSGMRAFWKRDVESFERLLPDRFSFTTTLTVGMMSAGMHVVFVPIDYCHRLGKSKFRPIRDTWNFAITLLRLGVYFAPLKVFLPIAAILGALGCVTLITDVFVFRDLNDRTLFLLIGALNIGVLGLLSDLISRK